jgi:cell division protein FtsQ
MIAEALRRPLRRRRVRRRGVPRGRGVALARVRSRVVLVLVALVLLLGGAWLWLRDSSLVAVKRVVVTGLSGPDAAKIRTALISEAKNMTTLDVRVDQLRTAVAPYPLVKDLRVSTQFPHGMRIRVVEQNPVAAITVDGRLTAVAGDGTLLHDVPVAASLPAIPLKVPPGGTRLTDPAALHAVELLAAAPYPLLVKVSQVTTVGGHGLVAQLRNGPSIYFGDAGRFAAKWLAATAVLADPGSAGAVYIDVTDPGRPAAGASGSGGSSSSATASSSSTTGSASGVAGGSPAGTTSGTTSGTGAGTGATAGSTGRGG